MEVISLTGLTRDFGNNKGVFDVTFQVKEGEVFGFLGPNGAGKSTTIRHLMGFLKSESGSCMINGMDCLKDRHEIQRDLGYISGEINFFDDMTGFEYMKFLSDYRGLKNLDRQKELIERFQLDPRGKIKKMSKGMKQKLGIITAFMHSPKILILDEPTSGLDPLMQKKFIELLDEEKKRGATILLSSHIFEEVEKTCDRIGIIRDGRLVTVDEVENLRSRHMHSYSVMLENEQEAEQFAKDFDGIAEGKKVSVTARQSLEDIFMNYYGGDGDDK